MLRNKTTYFLPFCFFEMDENTKKDNMDHGRKGDVYKRQAPEGVEVSYAMGSEFSEADEDEKAKALALAAKSDVIVAVVGGSSSRFGGAVFDANGAASKGTGSRSMDCGEGMDTAKVHIPAAQEELVAELARLGKPMVTVVIAGRAYCIDDIENASNALLYAFYPGPMGEMCIRDRMRDGC